MARLHATLLRRFLIAYLLEGAIVCPFVSLSLFSSHSTREELVIALAIGGASVVCTTILVVWLRIAMRRARRDQA